MIRTERLTLGQIAEEDLPFLVSLDRQASTIEFERDAPKDEEEIRRAYRAVIGRGPEGRGMHCVIRVANGGVPVGRARVEPMNDAIGEYEAGWACAREHWGNGYMTEAMEAMLRLAFGKLGAHRLVAFCDSRNLRSENLMRRLGMTREGEIRETKKLGGRWRNELVYSILDREFGRSHE